jgi:hypothetical protein
MNDGGWQSYTLPITITIPGTTTVVYHSADLASNVEDIQTITVKAYTTDTVAPTTVVEVSPQDTNGWHRSRVTLTLAAQDDYSGVDYTLYRMNSGGWKTYTVPITVTAQGTTTLAYYSVDVEGNVEEVQTITIRIDLAAPSSVANTPHLLDSSPITVTWIATDTLSGVASVALWYTFGIDGVWTDSGLAPQSGGGGTFYFDPVHSDGTYCFATQATDRAGNTEPEPLESGDTCCEYTGRPDDRHAIYLPVVLRN